MVVCVAAVPSPVTVAAGDGARVWLAAPTVGDSVAGNVASTRVAGAVADGTMDGVAAVVGASVPVGGAAANVVDASGVALGETAHPATTIDKKTISHLYFISHLVRGRESIARAGQKIDASRGARVPLPGWQRKIVNLVTKRA